MWQPKVSELLHEVLLTEFLLNFPKAFVIRGKHVRKKPRADAIMTLTNSIHIEMDTGSESRQIVDRRVRAYVGEPNLVIWVCRTEARMQWLMRRVVNKRTALFTVLETDLLHDLYGNTLSLNELS